MSDTATLTCNANANAHVSVAASFPFELVEATLLQLSIEDLLIVAPNIPKSWRDVIENSSSICHKVTCFRPITIRIIMDESWSSTDYFFVNDGVVLVHRRLDGAQGWLFVEKTKNGARVLDPKPAILCSLDNGQSVIQWLDLEGTPVCEKVMGNREMCIFRRYVGDVGHADGSC